MVRNPGALTYGKCIAPTFQGDNGYGCDGGESSASAFRKRAMSPTVEVQGMHRVDGIAVASSAVLADLSRADTRKV